MLSYQVSVWIWMFGFHVVVMVVNHSSSERPNLASDSNMQMLDFNVHQQKQ